MPLTIFHKNREECLRSYALFIVLSCVPLLREHGHHSQTYFFNIYFTYKFRVRSIFFLFFPHKALVTLEVCASL